MSARMFLIVFVYLNSALEVETSLGAHYGDSCFLHPERFRFFTTSSSYSATRPVPTLLITGVKNKLIFEVIST